MDKHVELWGNTRKELLYNRVNFKMSLLRTRNEMLPKAVRCLNRILQKPLVNSAVVASPVLIRNCCVLFGTLVTAAGCAFKQYFFWFDKGQVAATAEKHGHLAVADVLRLQCLAYHEAIGVSH